MISDGRAGDRGPAQPFAGMRGVVTGGASGIGLACVELLVARGAAVIVADTSLANATAAADRLGELAVAAQVDVTVEADCERMCDQAIESFGGIDFAINAAGVGNRDKSPIDRIPFDEYRRVMSVNIDGVFLSMSAELRRMHEGGSIVNIASIMGAVATDGAAAYVASKHAVVGLTKAAAIDTAPRGIRVNAIGPGYIETPMLQNKTSEQLRDAGARHPIGRLGLAEEIAETALFLVSPASQFTTGSFVLADGGYTAR